MIVRELFARLGLDLDAAAFNAAGAAIGALRGGLLGVGAAVGAMAVGLATAVGLTTKAAGDFDDMSKRTGIATKTLQELKYAGDLSGVSLEQISTGLKFIAKNAVAAAGGSKEASAGFARLGIRVRDSNGNIKDADTLLMEAERGLQGISNSSERTAIAMQLFGRSGTELLAMFGDEKKSLADVRAEAQAFGAVMDDNLITAGDHLGDNLTKVKYALIGIRNMIGKRLIHIVDRIVERFLEWYKANQKLIDQRIEKALAALTTGLEYVWMGIEKILPILGWMIDNWQVMAVLLGSTLLAAMVANTEALGTLGSSFLTMGLNAVKGWALALGPILLVAAGITAVILLIQDMWTALKGGETLLNWKPFLNWATGWQDTKIKSGVTPLAESARTPERDAMMRAQAIGPKVLAPNVRANVAINIPPGMPPEQAQEYTKRGVLEALGAAFSDAEAGVQ